MDENDSDDEGQNGSFEMVIDDTPITSNGKIYMIKNFTYYNITSTSNIYQFFKAFQTFGNA